MRTFLPQTMLICQRIHKSPLWRLSSGLCKLMPAEASRAAMMSFLVKKSLGFNFFSHFILGTYIHLSSFRLLLPIVPFQFLPLWEEDHALLQHNSLFQASEGLQASLAPQASLPLLSWPPREQLLQFPQASPRCLVAPKSWCRGEGKDEDFRPEVASIDTGINKQGGAPGQISLKRKG